MNREITSSVSGQNIQLKDRKKLEVSGIKKVESLNNEEFIIDTKLGLLLVRGKELEMQSLDMDKGNIWISGMVNAIEYIDEPEKKEKNGFFKKMFK